MKNTILYTIVCLSALTSCREYATIATIQPMEGQIIANHTVINDFDKIPQYYLDQVKKMMVFFPGESHSKAYREGMTLLQSEFPDYKCNVSAGESSTDQHLRVNTGDPIGEAEWFTWHAYTLESRPPASNVIKNLISEYFNQGYPINAIGFGWCWDAYGEYSKLVMLRDILKGDRRIFRDPEFGVYWYGASLGGPDGTRVWGLDSTDFADTGNRVGTKTYLDATEDYISFCKEMGYDTKIVFTTGPADRFTGENGYQGFLKNQYIRNYAAEDPSRILFDYNDILCHDDDGNTTTTTWKEHTYPIITPTNLGDGSVGHISPAGAIRLAKAQWWMLARIAGWDGK